MPEVRGALSAALGLALLACSSAASAGALRLEAYDTDGKLLFAPALLAHIAPRGRPAPAGGGIYVTGLDDQPAGGRPWLVSGATWTALTWTGPSHVKVTLPWPVAEDGFSTVTLDNDGAGYADGDAVLLQEAIAATEYRLFKESLQERLGSWEPTYKPSRKAKELQEAAQEALASAKGQRNPAKRAALCEKALTRISSAWAKMLFEHGIQVAAHPKRGPALRWGLTLDETLASRVSDLEEIAGRVGRSGANWVRLVFRKNAEDFAYENARSFIEYDAAVASLTKNKLHIMGSVLDSTMWPRDLETSRLEARTRSLVLRYKDTIRSWEVASEPNGNWLGGVRNGLSEDAIRRGFEAAAAEVKRIDPSLETVATLYWWEGTAADDRHPTFAWLKRAAPQGAFRQIDVVGLSIYPDEHPMGLAFDPAFRRLRQALPDKALMLAGFGYVEGRALDGYWWLDPSDIDGARKDLAILYTGAAPAVSASLGGGFYWPTLSTMLNDSREGDSLLKIYRRTLARLGR